MFASKSLELNCRPLRDEPWQARNSGCSASVQRFDHFLRGRHIEAARAHEEFGGWIGAAFD